MTSHELARILLEHEDLPVLTHANNHTTSPFGYGETIRVGECRTGYPSKPGAKRHVVIGNFSRRMINYPNEWIYEPWTGPLPNQWRYSLNAEDPRDTESYEGPFKGPFR